MWHGKGRAEPPLQGQMGGHAEQASIVPLIKIVLLNRLYGSKF